MVTRLFNFAIDGNRDPGRPPRYHKAPAGVFCSLGGHMGWTDYRSRPINLGAIVLDDQGRAWQVTDKGGYGRENIAQCDGVAYTRGDGVAVRLGLTFLLSTRGDVESAPESQKAGLELYNRWYNRDISPDKSEELAARKWKGRNA